MSGHSFEFSVDHGVIPIGAPGDDFPIIGAHASLFRPPQDAAQAPQAAAKTPAVSDKPLNVVKAAKARLKAVNSEIKRLRKLEAERDELVRLLAAAHNKPRANLRDISLSTAKRG